MTELMVNPPTLSECSTETVEGYNKERSDILHSLKRRALNMTEALNSMVNINSQQIEGSMYAFPSIKFSKKAIEAARLRKMEPDLFYCLNLLEQTGIVLVPGSGFKQVLYYVYYLVSRHLPFPYHDPHFARRKTPTKARNVQTIQRRIPQTILLIFAFIFC